MICRADTVLRVSLGPNTRTAREWAVADGPVHNSFSAESRARMWAREHGAAMILRMDGSGRLFFRDGDTIRQRTWSDVRPMRDGDGNVVTHDGRGHIRLATTTTDRPTWRKSA